MKKFFCFCFVVLSLILSIQPQASDCEWVLSYEDNGKQLFPMQISVDGRVNVSQLVPKRNGYVFGGWKKEKSDDVFFPGEELVLEKNTTLVPIWKIGTLSEPKLAVMCEDDGSVVFLLDFSFGGFAAYNSYEVHTENLSTDVQNTFIFETGEKELYTDELEPGQYKAYLFAEKYGITYKSPAVYFAVLSGEILEKVPLKIVLDGGLSNFAKPPLLIENYTYIALRHFCESMGAKVEWCDEDRSATIILEGTFIRVFENSAKCIVNGMEKILPAEVKLSDSTMYIPLRSIAELCGCGIVWDNNRTVYVFKDSDKRLSENIFYIETETGKYLSCGSDGIYLSEYPDFDSAWIFEVVDSSKGLYEIYNLNKLGCPLSVKDAYAVEGQKFDIFEKENYDGSLWKIDGNRREGYIISFANAPTMFLDADKLCLGSLPQKIKLWNVESFE
ncbi:MAG: copper amine oxidase N-terminal domain-containing protein [Clostridia bacterium]|nr:copper amine oxidase N-terminal domain-containing protein [Clostridia bacterium]